jgi:hypothetical protein
MLSKKLRLTIVTSFVLYLSGMFSGAEAAKVDIKTIAAAGHVNGKEYENSYFGVSVLLPQPNEDLTLNSLVADNRAILLRALNAKGNTDQWHTFMIAAHSAEGFTSTVQFVRSIRHQLESEGLQTVRAEIPVTIGGREFIQSDLKMESKKENYWKAVLFTQIKGCMFGFWMEMKSQEQLDKITKLDGRVRFR